MEEDLADHRDAAQAGDRKRLEDLKGDVGVGGAEDHAVEEVGKANCQNVEHDTDDRLILPEQHRPHRHDQAAEHTGQRTGQHTQPQAAGPQCHQVGEKCAEQHFALQ